MKRKRPQFVIRKIKNRSVIIYGRTYHAPEGDTQAVDGKRYGFGLYQIGEHFDSAVCFMGSERFCKARGEEWERLYSEEVPLQDFWHEDNHEEIHKAILWGTYTGTPTVYYNNVGEL